MMRGCVCAALLMGAVIALGQSVQDSTNLSRHPYTAEYKLTSEKKAANGATATTEATEVQAFDSRGRRMTARTDSSEDAGQGPRTEFSVSDPVNHTMSHWTSPGTTVTIIHAPDLGEPETECAKKVKAIDPLHPAVAGEKPAIQDLGMATIDGVTARGGRVSFRMPIFKLEDGPYVRTNEVWTATDPELDALRVRLISDAGPKGKSTQELVKLTRGEPDPSLFKAPTDRTITEREGQAYSCGVKPGVAPATPRPAQ